MNIVNIHNHQTFQPVLIVDDANGYHWKPIPPFWYITDSGGQLWIMARHSFTVFLHKYWLIFKRKNFKGHCLWKAWWGPVGNPSGFSPHWKVRKPAKIKWSGKVTEPFISQKNSLRVSEYLGGILIMKLKNVIIILSCYLKKKWMQNVQNSQENLCSGQGNREFFPTFLVGALSLKYTGTPSWQVAYGCWAWCDDVSGVLAD